MYFLFVFLVVLIYCLIQVSHLNEDKKRKGFCISAFLVILFVHLFKDNSMYPDLIRYELEFAGIADIKGFKNFYIQYFSYGGYFHEFGWSLLVFLYSRCTDDFTIFLKIVSIGICSGYSYGIYKMSKSPLFSFLFIMLYSTALPQSFYVLRQHLAFSLFFFLIPFLFKKDYIKFFLGYLFIFSLHYSSIILFPFVVFYQLGNKIFSFKRIIFAALLIYALEFLLNNLTYERYAGYITNSGSNLLAAILTGAVLLTFLLTQSAKPINDQYDLYMHTYIIFSFIVCLTCLGSNTGRLTNYFTLFLSSTVPYAVQNLAKPIRLVAYSLFIALSILINLNSEWSYLYYNLVF